MKKNYFKSLIYAALLVAAPFVATSCDDVIGQEDNPVASYVQWKTDADVDEVEMKVGGTYTRVATAVSSAIIAYESDNTEIATVDPVSGEVTAKKIGEANISAVISGMSTNGRNVFEATKLTYKVNVIDKKIYVKALVEKTDSIVDFTVNKDTIVDFSKKFKVFPATGLTVTYSVIPTANITALPAADKPKDHPHYNSGIASINATTGKLTIQNATGWCWVEAKITSAAPTGYDDNTTALKKDTIKVRVKDAIAYLNEKGERTILTTDKFNKLSKQTPAAGKVDTTFKAGIYYIDTDLMTAASERLKVKIAGDVTFILKNGASAQNWTIANLVDADDTHKLNIFLEAKTVTTPVASTLTVNRGSGGDAITNFKEINVYGGTLDGRSSAANCGGFAAIKNLNVKGGKVIARNSTNGYGISLADGGKLTIAGGEVEAVGTGSSTTFGFALIGDVEVSKGKFAAQNPDYRAVKGNMTAGGSIKFKTSANGSTYSVLEGTTSTAPYVKAE